MPISISKRQKVAKPMIAQSKRLEMTDGTCPCRVRYLKPFKNETQYTIKSPKQTAMLTNDFVNTAANWKSGTKTKVIGSLWKFYRCYIMQKVTLRAPGDAYSSKSS